MSSRSSLRSLFIARLRPGEVPLAELVCGTGAQPQGRLLGKKRSQSPSLEACTYGSTVNATDIITHRFRCALLVTSRTSLKDDFLFSF